MVLGPGVRLTMYAHSARMTISSTEWRPACHASMLSVLPFKAIVSDSSIFSPRRTNLSPRNFVRAIESSRASGRSSQKFWYEYGRSTSTRDYHPIPVNSRLLSLIPHYQVDLFSLGVILYYLLTGKHPFFEPGADDLRSIQAKILGLEPRLSKSRLSADARQLCSALLQKDPRMRVSAAQALQYPFVARSGGAFQPKVSTPSWRGAEVRFSLSTRSWRGAEVRFSRRYFRKIRGEERRCMIM